MKIDINPIVEKVIKMVENGDTISKALVKVGTDRTTFYRLINKEQKVLIQMAKTANAKYGMVKQRYSIK